MGLVRDGWKLSFRRSSFSSSSSLPPPSPPPASANPGPPDPPPEFLCPISGALMADPVIVPSGETYERASIEACRDLTVFPLSPSLDISSSLLIPNAALRSAIVRWCDVAGVPRPLPLSSSAAIRHVRRLLPSSHPKSHTVCSTELPTTSSSSSNSSDEIIVAADSSNEALKTKPPEPYLITASMADPLEERIVAKMKRAQIQDQQTALISLLEATRESSERRVLLGTPRLLASLRSLLLSRHADVKSTALAVIVNLSLETPNKVRIIRSGAIPAIVDSLHPSTPAAARDHAAGVLFSLALDEQNRTALGVLGAVPPLLCLFCSVEEGLRARMESGMALYHLSLAQFNKAKLVRIAGAVKGLLTVAKGEERELRRVALRLMAGIVECKEGKAVMLDGGAVEEAVALLKKPAVEAEEEEMLVRMLHGMSSGGLRFRGMARRAGAEDVLERAAKGRMGEMAMMALQAIREEEDREREVARILGMAAAAEVYEDSSGSSDTELALRRLNRKCGGASGSISAGF